MQACCTRQCPHLLLAVGLRLLALLLMVVPCTLGRLLPILVLPLPAHMAWLAAALDLSEGLANTQQMRSDNALSLQTSSAWPTTSMVHAQAACREWQLCPDLRIVQHQAHTPPCQCCLLRRTAQSCRMQAAALGLLSCTCQESPAAASLILRLLAHALHSFAPMLPCCSCQEPHLPPPRLCCSWRMRFMPISWEGAILGRSLGLQAGGNSYRKESCRHQKRCNQYCLHALGLCCS